jgi:diacylglycerol kinase family enzyme
MPARPPLPVIVNAAGGTASRAGEKLAGQITAAFEAAHQPIALELVRGDELQPALQRQLTAPRVVVGGGDGTLNTAAAILPLGTLNHFARQAGISEDLDKAAKLAAEGSARRVDLGAAAERAFVNNLSAGAYVELIRRREASRLPKFLAAIPAAWRTLRTLRSRPFDLSIDGERCSVRTPLLFVGNNRYEVEEGRPAERPALDDGLLSVYAIAPLSRIALLGGAVRTLVGRARMHRDFALDRVAREVRIEGPGTSVEVALDGERCRFDLPLTIRINPRALAVVAPEGN